MQVEILEIRSNPSTTVAIADHYAAVASIAGVPSDVQVIDTKTNTVIVDFKPYEATFLGGIDLAVGDISYDGVPELFVSPLDGGGPRVQVFDGQDLIDGKLTKIADFYALPDPTFRGGAKITVADVNGDYDNEVIATAAVGGGPRYTVWDGNDVDTANTNQYYPGKEAIILDTFAFDDTLRGGVNVVVPGNGGMLFTAALADGTTTTSYLTVKEFNTAFYADSRYDD